EAQHVARTRHQTATQLLEPRRSCEQAIRRIQHFESVPPRRVRRSETIDLTRPETGRRHTERTSDALGTQIRESFVRRALEQDAEDVDAGVVQPSIAGLKCKR